eukprot:20738_3
MVKREKWEQRKSIPLQTERSPVSAKRRRRSPRHSICGLISSTMCKTFTMTCLCSRWSQHVHVSPWSRWLSMVRSSLHTCKRPSLFSIRITPLYLKARSKHTAILLSTRSFRFLTNGAVW